MARLLQGPLATHAARAAALGRRLAAPLQHDHAAGCVPTSWLWPRRSPPTTRDLRGVLLHSGALLQGTLDLLERAALNPTGETREDAAGSGGRAAQESERRAALQILANLTRHDVSLRALFEDHPALDGVVLPQTKLGVGVRGGQASFSSRSPPRQAAPSPNADALCSDGCLQL